MSDLLGTINEALPYEVKFCDETAFPANEVIAWEEINGRKFPRVYWHDVTNRYPDTWVCYTGSKHCGGKNIFSAVIVSICAEGERQRTLYELMKMNYPVGSQKTFFHTEGW